MHSLIPIFHLPQQRDVDECHFVVFKAPCEELKARVQKIENCLSCNLQY